MLSTPANRPRAPRHENRSRSAPNRALGSGAQSCEDGDMSRPQPSGVRDESKSDVSHGTPVGSVGDHPPKQGVAGSRDGFHDDGDETQHPGSSPKDSSKNGDDREYP